MELLILTMSIIYNYFIAKKKSNYSVEMRARDTKGRFIKLNGSSDKQTEGGGRFKDIKGRWHKPNGKFV